MPMNCYLITIGGSEDFADARVAIQAPTAQDAVTVADISYRTTVYDAEANCRRERRPNIRALQCLGAGAAEALPTWKQGEFARRGYVDVDEHDYEALIRRGD